MGIFDGILICSDWDGTLAVGNRIPESNVSAIRRFQSEGGKFTICTGRYFPYIDGFADIVRPNTHLISLNGACIVDEVSRERIYEGFLPPCALTVMDEALAINSSFKQINFFMENSQAAVSLTVPEYTSGGLRLQGNRLYKIVLIANAPEDAVFLRDYVNAASEDSIISVRSWHTGVEILPSEFTKGKAALKLKEMTGAKALVCVGDFENDVSMLSVADVSYAVDGAAPEALLVADNVCADVESGAIADVICDLERRIREGLIKDID